MADEQDISIFIKAISSGWSGVTSDIQKFLQQLEPLREAQSNIASVSDIKAFEAYSAALEALVPAEQAASSSMLGLANLDALSAQRVTDLAQAQAEAIAINDQYNASKLAGQTQAMTDAAAISAQQIRELTTAEDEAIATNNLYNASLQAMKEVNFSSTSSMLSVVDLQDRQTQSTQTLTQVQESNIGIVKQAQMAWVALAAEYYVVSQAINTVIGVLQQLYDAAAQGAQFERLQTSGAALAATFGVDLPAAVAKLKAASLDTISSQTAMIDVNKALLVGAVTNVQDLSNLMLVAANNGRAIGLSASDAFDQVIRGVSGLSTRLLGFAGIVVSDTKAYADYAASIGTTAAALDGQQKRQALVNAILQTYLPLVKQAGGLTDDNAAAYERFAADATDLANQQKALLADAITPLIRSLDTLLKQIELLTNPDFSSMAASSSSVQDYTNKVTTSQKSLRDALGTTVVGIAQTANTIFEQLIPGYKAAYEASDPLANATEKLAKAHLLLSTAMSDAIQSHKDWIAAQVTLADAVDKSTAALQKMLDTSDKLSFADIAKKAYDFAVSVTGVTAATDQLGLSLGLTDPAFLKARDNLIALENQAKATGDTMGITADAIRQAWSPIGFSMLETLHVKLGIDLGDAQAKFDDLIAKLKTAFDSQKIKDALDFSRTMAGINTDQARRIEDLNTQTQQKEEALADTHNRRLETIEIEHQRQIQQIMQRYDLSRLNALIDLNGKALFQANAQRDADLANAALTAKQKAQDEQVNYDQALKDLQDAQQQQRDAIQKDEDRKRADAQKAYDQKRQDAQTAFDTQYAQDQTNFDTQKILIQTAYQNQRDAIGVQLGLIQKDNRESLNQRTQDFLDFVAANDTILQALINGTMTIDQVRKQFLSAGGINWGGVPFQPPDNNPHNCPPGWLWDDAQQHCYNPFTSIGAPVAGGGTTPTPAHNVRVTLNVTGDSVIASMVRTAAMNAFVDIITE
jgi:hypothetical protein